MNNEPGVRTHFAGYSARHFRWAVSERVGHVTLDRPERKNPLTFESYAELRDLFRALVHAEDVRAVVITGAGGNFCSGGDVHEIIGPLTRMEVPQLLRFTRMTGDLVKAMRACPQPVVVALDGVCAGAGAAIALAADLRLGTAAAQHRVPVHARRTGRLRHGRVRAPAADHRPGARGRAPLHRARHERRRGRAPGASSTALTPPEELLPAALKLAGELAAGPTFAHGMTKTMLQQEWNMGVEQAIDAEAEAQALCMKSGGLPARLRGLRRQAHAGVRGRLMSAPEEALSWPFFEPQHRALSRSVGEFAATHLAHAVHPEERAAVDARCRELVASARRRGLDALLRARRRSAGRYRSSTCAPSALVRETTGVLGRPRRLRLRHAGTGQRRDLARRLRAAAARVTCRASRRVRRSPRSHCPSRRRARMSLP